MPTAADNRATCFFRWLSDFHRCTLEAMMEASGRCVSRATLHRLITKGGRWSAELLERLIGFAAGRLGVATDAIRDFIANARLIDGVPFDGCPGAVQYHPTARHFLSLHRTIRAKARTAKIYCALRHVPPLLTMSDAMMSSYAAACRDNHGNPLDADQRADVLSYLRRQTATQVQLSFGPASRLILQTKSGLLRLVRAEGPFSLCPPPDIVDCVESLLAMAEETSPATLRVVDDAGLDTPANSSIARQIINRYETTKLIDQRLVVLRARGTSACSVYDRDQDPTALQMISLVSDVFQQLVSGEGGVPVLDRESSMTFLRSLLPANSWYFRDVSASR